MNNRYTPMHNIPIDIERLHLFTDGDPAEEKELSRLFLEQAELMITQMEKSVDETQREDWKCTAHRFKGSASNLGANHLQQLCELAELTDGKAKKQEVLSQIRIETQSVAAFFNKPRIVNTGRAFVGDDTITGDDREIIL